METLEEKKQRHAQLTNGRVIAKCDAERVYDLIQSANVKNIKTELGGLFQDYNMPKSHSGKVLVNEIGGLLLNLIKQNSNDFTKDISEKTLLNEYELSEKQAWCLAYQIKNNKQVYINAVLEYWDIATASAEVNEIQDKESIEMDRLNFEIFKAENAK